MNRTARNGALVLAALVVVVALALLLVNRVWVPTAPGDGRLPLVARASLEGPVGPEPMAGDDVDVLPRTPAGSECLDRIERPAGGLDLCWQAYRERREADADQDYYQLRVFGSFGFESGSGIRWVAVQVEPDGSSAQVLDSWPTGVYEGECTQVTVALGPGQPTPETVCGRTKATSPDESESRRVDWTCTSCLFPDRTTRAFALDEFVVVPAGAIPGWRIYADLGG